MSDLPHQSSKSGSIDFSDVLNDWRQDGWEVLFSAIWQGYHDLFADPDVDLRWGNENQVTSRLIRRVWKYWPRYSAFQIFTQEGIEENRKSKFGLPPTPDVTISIQNSQIMAELHVEAKVIRHSKDLLPYVREIQGNFCTGKYCPRSSIGALFAYCADDFPDLPKLISAKCEVEFQSLEAFSPNLHFKSEHLREGSRIRLMSPSITLHHFFMPTKPESVNK